MCFHVTFLCDHVWCVFLWLSFSRALKCDMEKKLKTCKSDSRRCTRGWICVWNEQPTNNKKRQMIRGGESNLLQICPRHLLHFPHPFWAIKVVVIAKRQFQWFMIHDWLLWLLTIDDISNDGWWFSCFFLTTDFCSDLMDWPNSGSLWGTLALWRQDTLAGGRWTWRPANYMPHAVLDRTNHIERSSVFGVPHYL